MVVLVVIRNLDPNAKEGFENGRSNVVANPIE